MAQGSISWSEAWAAIAAFLSVSGTLWLIWWKIVGIVKEAKEAAYHKSDEAKIKAEAAAATAMLSREELATYKTHVAETYISKAGHRETTDQIMGAIKELGGDVRGIRQRMDTFLDNERKSARKPE